MNGAVLRLSFDAGTLLAEYPLPELPECLKSFFRFDDRVNRWRCYASEYAPVLRAAAEERIPVEDHVREYRKLDLKIHSPFPPMPHQQAALQAWKNADPPGRGVTVLPTGAGKTYLAVLAIASVQRSALILVPTIDLLQQWASALERFFAVEIGMLGGGSKEIRDITVSTYDSALIFMERIGNRFGLAVFDECHHLPGEMNRMAAKMAIAPYRLGLSATPERSDGGEELLYALIGPKVYEIFIDQLEGKVLAPYVLHRIEVPLSPEEEEEYRQERKIYLDFIHVHGIDFREPDGWQRFLALSSRLPGGRRAFQASLRQKFIARCGKGKKEVLWNIIRKHFRERILIFTADNDAAYDIGNLLCAPVITHKTKAAERKDFLDRFRTGEYSVLVTSKVLNEGVDVPEAAVGVILSGSGSTREHVQRLGRILRASEGKQAQLYELVSAQTAEMYTSERRRDTRAYRKRMSFRGTGGEE